MKQAKHIKPVSQGVQTLADEKALTLAKLLAHGPESMQELVNITGWSYEVTQKALLKLITLGQVKCSYAMGFRQYGLRSSESADQPLMLY